MASTAWTVGAAPHEKKIEAIVASAIEIAPPERIILFGPAARGEMVEDGDLDWWWRTRAQAMRGTGVQRGAAAAKREP